MVEFDRHEVWPLSRKVDWVLTKARMRLASNRELAWADAIDPPEDRLGRTEKPLPVRLAFRAVTKAQMMNGWVMLPASELLAKASDHAITVTREHLQRQTARPTPKSPNHGRASHPERNHSCNQNQERSF